MAHRSSRSVYYRFSKSPALQVRMESKNMLLLPHLSHSLVAQGVVELTAWDEYVTLYL